MKINSTSKRVLAGLAAAASLLAGGVAPAMAADTAVSPTEADKTITVKATTATAFDGKVTGADTDTVYAIQLGTFDGGTSDGANLKGIRVTTSGDAAFKKAIADAATAGGATNVDANNPVANLMALAGDNGEGTPAYASDLRNAVTALNKNGALDSAAKITGTVTKDDKAGTSVLTFKVPAAGYYLIRDTTPEGKTGAIPMLVGTTLAGQSFAGVTQGTIVYKSIDDDNKGTDPNNPNKNVDPPDKTSDGKTTVAHSIGDEVTYTVTQKVPNWTGYDGYRFELKDTLGKGLDYVAGSATITIDGNALDAKYVKTTEPANAANHDKQDILWQFGLDHEVTKADGSKETVRDILNGDAKAVFGIGKTITVTYKAKLNAHAFDDAAAGQNGIVNVHSNNPNAWWSQTSTTVPTNPPVSNITGTFHITSTDMDGKTPKNDVTFQLLDKAGNPIQFVKTGDGTYRKAADGETGTPDLATKKGGNTVTITGVVGDVHIKQTTGYTNDYLADWKTTVNADKTADGTTKTTVTDPTENKNNLAQKDGDDGFIVKNAKSAAALAQTGATTYVLGSMAGAAMLALALFAAAKSRKRFHA